MILKEYGMEENSIEAWLPYRGITYPTVMRQKDSSYFSVIEYRSYLKQNVKLNNSNFKRGWSMWVERQHNRETTRNFIVIAWNPFFGKLSPYAENTLEGKYTRKQTQEYFVKEVNLFLQNLKQVTKADLLSYQQLIDFLSFSLSVGELQEGDVKMPDLPIKIDSLLARHLNFEFLSNGIKINNKNVFIVSILGMPTLNTILDMLEYVPYRHVRRMLFFDDKEAKIDLDKYAAKWCKQRKTMKNFIFEDILKEINGYFAESFIFLLDEKHNHKFRIHMSQILNKEKMMYIFETYNLKDVFWGSLPGIYLANITPPIIGLNFLDDLLHHTDEQVGEVNV